MTDLLCDDATIDTYDFFLSLSLIMVSTLKIKYTSIM